MVTVHALIREFYEQQKESPSIIECSSGAPYATVVGVVS
jgi:hypothetical protein